MAQPNTKLVMKPLTPDHPYYQLLANFRTYMKEKKEFELSWIRSYCLWENKKYRSVLKSTFQIALAEQLLLFGKDPIDVIKYEFVRDGDFYKYPEDMRFAAERSFINQMLQKYNEILFPPNVELAENAGPE